ncbi:MAG TPA: C1 family peptidase [Chitinophagales bacterium]|nr:C1 family peptidase [Chitinophagales bacterium]
MKKHIFSICLLALLGAIFQNINAQHTNTPDKAVFVEGKGSYYINTILKDIRAYDEQATEPEPPKKGFKLQVADKNYPTNPDDYQQQWHQKPISQGNTGTCWCFSTTSFFESEIKRISGKAIKLSELYPVYFEYVERARLFVQKRGHVNIGEGSETNAVAKLYKKYGVVPLEAYKGKPDRLKFHNPEKMFAEFDGYLKNVKSTNAWDEDRVVETVKSILNYYMGEPPTEFMLCGKKITPLEYLKSECKLNMDDYVDFMSLMQEPYFTKTIYDVPDNWWRSTDYYNVPLNDFTSLIKTAIKKGYTISIGGDVSEAGFVNTANVAVVPTFDCPAEYIDENARQMRFLNGSTTDDHAMHLVGVTEKNGETWYLLKDSSSGSRGCAEGEACKQFGYYFMREDYVKLKMMTVTLHKDAVKDLIAKVK